MPIAINEGLVDDLDILQNERVVDMSEIIGLLETEWTQFTTALMKVRSKPANSSKVEWLEDRLFPRKSALTGAVAATGSPIVLPVTVGEGIYFNVGDLVRNTKTGEAFEVLSVAADNVTAKRPVGRFAMAAGTTADEVIIVGNASLQGATLPPPKVVERVPMYNYTQIFRLSYSFTRTLTQSKLYTGGEPNYERKKKGTEHKRQLESALFFGARDLDSSGSEPQGFMGGLQEFIITNLHDAATGGAPLTPTELDTFLQTDLQHGSGQNKVIFAAPTFARVISTYARDNWTRTGRENTIWGVKIDGLVSGAYGYEIPVFVKREWGDLSTAGYGGWAFVVDMDAVRLRPLQNTVLLRNRQANDADRVTEEYLTETSFELHNEQKHAIIKNVTS